MSALKLRISRARRFSIVPSTEVSCSQFLSALQKIHNQFVGMDHRAKTEAEQRENQLRQGDGKIGQQLADLTIRRVILLVITLLVVLPYLSVLSKDVNQEQLFGLAKLHTHVTKWNATMEDSWFRTELEIYANRTKPVHAVLFSLDPGQVHLFLKSQSDQYIADYSAIAKQFRRSEVNVAVAGDCDGSEQLSGCDSYAVFDISDYAELEAMYSILRTLFITCCFVVGSFVLTHDTTTAVVVPIERMTSMVHKLSKNPLSELDRTNGPTSTYEIKLLEETLTKVASLLQIGFGEAGASIISNNIREGGTFNPIVSGKKVHAIFGFCNIKSFTDITECLKEEVMLFTNTIAMIVHEAVHSFNGTTNRNLGDAFLIVWKLPPRYQQDATYMKSDRPPRHLAGDTHSISKRVSYRKSSSLWIPSMADNALLAFMKTMVDISSSMSLDQYRDHPLLMRHFDYPFETQMMYGLHIGWAIEGAIGSIYKIDASYLAPDVNMASRLGAATRQFQVPLLMSHCFYNCLSPRLQQYCRCIDCVIVKGSSKPIALYTCDYVKAPIHRFTGIGDLPKLQHGLTSDFYMCFQTAVDAYFSGDFPSAKTALVDILKHIKPDDGPSLTLLSVIESHDDCAPSDWPGFRELFEK